MLHDAGAGTYERSRIKVTRDDVLVEGDRFISRLPVEKGVVVHLLISSHHLLFTVTR